MKVFSSLKDNMDNISGKGVDGVKVEQSASCNDWGEARRRGFVRGLRATTATLFLFGSVAGASLANAAAASPQARPCEGLAYTAQADTHELAVIDTRTHQLVKTISVGDSPTHPRFTPDGSQLYVINVLSGNFSVIDVASGTEKSRVPAGGEFPVSFAFTPDGKRMVITYLGVGPRGGRWTPGAVRVMDLGTGKTSAPVTVGYSPERVAISSNGKTAYVVNARSDSVSVIDLAAYKLVDTIPVGDHPLNIVIGPDNQTMYVSNTFDDSISEIDTRFNKVIREFKTSDGPNGMAFSPDGKKMYVTTLWRRGKLQEIDRESGYVIRTNIDVNPLPGHLDISADGKSLYLVKPYGHDVVAVDTVTFNEVGRIKLKGEPNTVTMCR